MLACIGVNQAVNFGLFSTQIQFLSRGAEADTPLIWQTTFTPIAPGVLLAHLLDREKSFLRFHTLIGRRWSSLGLFVVLLVLRQFSPENIQGLPRLLMQFTLMLMLGSVVVREDQPGVGSLRLAPLRFVGMVSYGVYLYHMYAIHGVQVIFGKLHLTPDRAPGGPLVYDLSFFFTALVASVLVAGLSFRLFEEPILKLKSRFSSSWTTSVRFTFSIVVGRIPNGSIKKGSWKSSPPSIVRGVSGLRR